MISPNPNCSASATEDVPESELSSQQRQALRLQLEGDRDYGEIAAEVGVHRTTFHRWRTEDPHYRAELNRRREARRRQEFDNYARLIRSATDVLIDELEQGNAELALRLLKLRGQLSGQAPTGPTNPTELQVRHRIAEELRTAGLLSLVPESRRDEFLERYGNTSDSD